MRKTEKRISQEVNGVLRISARTEYGRSFYRLSPHRAKVTETHRAKEIAPMKREIAPMKMFSRIFCSTLPRKIVTTGIAQLSIYIIHHRVPHLILVRVLISVRHELLCKDNTFSPTFLSSSSDAREHRKIFCKDAVPVWCSARRLMMRTSW